MNRHDADALDRHITGNYGEDQFRDEEPSGPVDLERGDWWRSQEEHTPKCQVSNCDEDAEDGVLCEGHQEEKECEGHPSTSGPIGNVIYCDGTCRPTLRMKQICPTRTPEVHELGEFPMTCYRCHLEADS